MVRLLVGLICAAYLVALPLVPRGGNRVGNFLFDVAIFDLAFAGCGVLALLESARAPAGRAGWRPIGAGLVLWAAGNTYWSLWVVTRDPQPGASPADAAWLLFYALSCWGLVRLTRSAVARVPVTTLLDALTGGLAIGAAGAATLLAPILSAPSGLSLAVVTNLIYPCADLLVVCLVISMMLVQHGRLSRAWWLLGGGYLLFGLTDTIYLLRVAADTYRQGTWLDAGWLLSGVLLAVAAAQSEGRNQSQRRLSAGWAMVAWPGLFTFVAIVVLVAASVTEVTPAAVVLAAATLLVTAVRLSLTFRELNALTDSQRQARTDELTGLANRRLLFERLDEVLSTAGGASVALLLMDLDGFKEVNDTLGHPAGDQLLRGIARRLQDCVRPGDLLARLGGDEFAVVLTPGGRWQAEDLARRIRKAVVEPFFANGDLSADLPPGAVVYVDASIGIAVSPEHATRPAALLQAADLAMYRAKRQRAGHCLYDPVHLEESVARMRTGSEFRVAIQSNQIEVHYQPKMSLDTGHPIGVEALVRWRHPSQGLLSPLAFLPLLVDADRIRDLTAIVLDRALADCAHWASVGVRVPIAVNVSAADLEDPALPARVVRTLHRHALPPELLTLEVTETMLVTEPHLAGHALEEVRGIGVRVALDDYGTGFSSLTHLRDFPLSELKLDRTFVASLLVDPTTLAIVRSTIELAHTLGLNVVAEGVEEERSMEALQRLHCDQGQGHLWSAALPADDVLAWMAQRLAPVGRIAPHNLPGPVRPSRRATSWAEWAELRAGTTTNGH